MHDTQLYARVLGLSAPWRVEGVELDVPGQRVDLRVTHAESVRWPCPTCGQELAGYDHAEPRVWRHLDTCQLHTHLEAQVPRVQCPTHGVL